MRVPQVSDRIKEAPAQALRGVFAGIGQLLLITDKLRNKTPTGQQVPRARAPEPRADQAPPDQSPAPASPAPAPAPPAEVATEAAPAQRVPEARDFDKTGNVRLITGAEAGAGSISPAPRPAEPGPPLPNYDELSIASLRARLRNLDPTQLRQAAAYEKAHAARPDVITMFERRIAKLEAETTPEERGGARAEAEIEAREDVAADVREEAQAEAEGEE